MSPSRTIYQFARSTVLHLSISIWSALGYDISV